MKFLVLSDLHLEKAPFYPKSGVDYDAVILAGDIMPRAEKLPLWAARESQFGRRKPIVIVPGNHEYYDSVMQTSRAAMQASKPANVHVLSPGEVLLADGRIRVLGCTLWTDFQLPVSSSSSGSLEQKGRAMSAAREAVRDYRWIRIEEPGGLRRQLTPADTLALHLAERAWLLSKLREPFAGQTVVVTHHAPSAESVAPKYAEAWTTPAFVSQLPDEFFETAALWVHGHTHTSFDYVRGRTRVVCNPRGYPEDSEEDSKFENPEFDPSLVISVVLDDSNSKDIE
jgi:predicted phosphodiesterase